LQFRERSWRHGWQGHRHWRRLSGEARAAVIRIERWTTGVSYRRVRTKAECFALRQLASALYRCQPRSVPAEAASFTRRLSGRASCSRNADGNRSPRLRALEGRGRSTPLRIRVIGVPTQVARIIAGLADAHPRALARGAIQSCKEPTELIVSETGPTGLPVSALHAKRTVSSQLPQSWKRTILRSSSQFAWCGDSFNNFC
jgi:hypothetical protein